MRFSLKMKTFSFPRLHPFPRMATPFGVKGVAIRDKGCSLFLCALQVLVGSMLIKYLPRISYTVHVCVKDGQD